ncbi:gametocyte-specific factor 1 [Embiotoca jacksoni]|uniref:gametocyte-specific factor 1 n=1 Tax=Embiotoca jacksoni TaxID=100190 RepID=UPI003704A16A
MATVRFGSSSGPCKTAALRAELVEDNDDKGDDDPDKLVQCPYDKNHQIRNSRYPYHTLKCQKNHPKLASEMKTCPFNARHQMLKNKLAAHIETCPQRQSVNSNDAGNASENCQWHVPVSIWVNPNMTEDWDDEADDAAPPFVLGETSFSNCNRPSSQTPATRPTNSLGPRFRPPGTFPWSDDKK